MSVVKQWDFNPPTPWTVGAQCFIVNANPNAMTFPSDCLFQPGSNDAVVQRTITGLQTGHVYRCIIMANLSGFPDPMIMRASYSGTFLPGSAFWDGVSLDYQFWDMGFFTAFSTDRLFQIRGVANAGFGTCRVNQVFVQESFILARSRWKAYDALRTKLLTIQGGAAFHSNLGGRVFHRFINPRSQNVTFPYVCIPLATDSPVITDMQNMVKVEWTLNVFGFVGETDATEATTTAVRDALYLGEDIMQAVMLDRTLAGTVQDCELLSGGESVAGVDSELWGEVRVPLKLTLYCDKNDLKP